MTMNALPSAVVAEIEDLDDPGSLIDVTARASLKTG